LVIFEPWERFWTLWDGTWTPWIDIKIQKKKFLSTFWTFFSYWTLGQPLSTIWAYRSMLGSLQIEDFDWSFTLS